MTKTKHDLVRAWCEKGRRDLVTAELALAHTSEILPDIICFHAQQAAEKYLKAYLVYLEREFPKTHALEDLILIALMDDPGIRDLFILASELSPYAVEIRYPDALTPTIEDARDAVCSSEQIRDYILGNIVF